VIDIVADTITTTATTMDSIDAVIAIQNVIVSILVVVMILKADMGLEKTAALPQRIKGRTVETRRFGKRGNGRSNKKWKNND
jgi:hypothetical protein